jgi:hypothetical protein
MWYTAGDDQSRYTIGYATSSDGVRWTRMNAGQAVLNPGKGGKFDDQAVLHPSVCRDQDGQLHLWYNGVGPQKSFRVGHVVSSDGLNWRRKNEGDPVLMPSVVGSFHEEYVYNVFVRYDTELSDDGPFHMWYSAWAADSRIGEAKHNAIIHAVSKNGDRWRKDLVPTLTNGDAGSIDSYACFACYIIKPSDRLWMFYSAGDGQRNRNYRVGLATEVAR